MRTDAGRLGAITLVLLMILSIGISYTASKTSDQFAFAQIEDASESEKGFRKSENPLLHLPIDEEKWLPIVPPELVERPLDEDTEQTIEMVVYDVKTKEIKTILKNFTKSDKISLKMPVSQGSLPSDLILENPIGYGDRIRVTPTTSYPWRTICKLRMQFSGDWYMGSGFIIDDYHVLTAGHCVYDSSLGGWAETVKVIPALDDGYSPFYHALSTKITVNTDWLNYESYRNDFAIITLDRNIGDFTGWMGLEYASIWDPIYTGILNTAGYPGDLDGGGNMYWDSDYGEDANVYTHWYWMDTRPGQSGSPVWYYDDTNRFVLSIVTYGTDPEYPNLGTRFSEYWFDVIDQVFDSDTPPTDYANLIDDGQSWSGFSTTQVAPGKTPFNVWSGIRNIGTAESGDFYVSYYASEDTIISGSDYLIGIVSVPSITPFSYRDSVWSGTFPSYIPDGTYWVIWTIDSYNDVPEPLDEGEENNIAYKNSYQVTVESYPLINYYTNPSDVGFIAFNSGAYADGHSGNYLPGDYTITAYMPAGYDFHHWEYDNIGIPGVGVYVPNIGDNPSTASVSGAGWLKAVYETFITFRTEPSNSGSISYDGTVYNDGVSIREVRLPPDNTNIFAITANPSDGYIFSYWKPEGKIEVDSIRFITTDLTVNGPGVLTAVFEKVLEIDYVMTTDYVERDWGECGDTMVVLGSGATAGTGIILYWDYVTTACLVDTTVATPDGTFELYFDVPEAPGGVHYLWVEDTVTGYASVWGPFTVVPTITLDVENGPVGTVVTVSGSGFTENGMVDTITINGGSCTIINTILLVNPIGKITGAFVIPCVENLGVYEITVIDSSGLAANSDFLITGLAELVVSPTYGTPGATITITGSNFTQIAGTEVNIALYDDTTKVVDLVTAETKSDGTFEDAFISPPILFKTYDVVATDEYGIDADDPFKVGLIALIINPVYGEAGTRVSITGIGFAPGVYDLTFGDKLYEEYGIVSGGEAISDLFYVPNVEPGTYDVTITDTDENELTVQFTVTESTYVIADPAMAPNNYNVSIKGYNFADIKNGAVDFFIYNSTEDWAMDVWQNGAGTDPVVTDVDGNFTGWWIVPVKDTLSIGDYTVNVMGSAGLLVQVPFSVVEARVDVAPRKAQFNRGDIVAFDIMSHFKYPEAYIEIYDPYDTLYWSTATFVEDWWLLVEGLYTVPYYRQTAGLKYMELAIDAPLGIWSYIFYESGTNDLTDGTFIVMPLYPPLPPILSNLIITPPEIELGDEVTISFDIENIDRQSFTYTVAMQIGELTLLVDVELGAYEAKTVSRTIIPDAVGGYNVIVDGLTGSFEVKPSSRVHEIPLFVGWNLIGLPCTPEDPSIEVVLSEIIDYVVCVWAFDGETKTWSAYSPGAPSDLTEMVEGRGFWIKVNMDMILTIYGDSG